MGDLAFIGAVQLGDRGPRGQNLPNVSLWLEPVWLNDAAKVEYISSDDSGLWRVEFTSQQFENNGWRLSVQLPKHSTGVSELKIEMNQPPPNEERKGLSEGNSKSRTIKPRYDRNFDDVLRQDSRRYVAR